MSNLVKWLIIGVVAFLLFFGGKGISASGEFSPSVDFGDDAPDDGDDAPVYPLPPEDPSGSGSGAGDAPAVPLSSEEISDIDSQWLPFYFEALYQSPSGLSEDEESMRYAISNVNSLAAMDYFADAYRAAMQSGADVAHLADYVRAIVPRRTFLDSLHLAFAGTDTGTPLYRFVKDWVKYHYNADF